MSFVPGLEVSRRLHAEIVGPALAAALPGVPYAAARLDTGSDVLGYDTPRSMDHDWGCRLQLFVPAGLETEATRIAVAALPERFLGQPTRFAGEPVRGFGVPDPAGVRHGFVVSTLDSWFASALGFDPRAGVSTLDWLATPTQRLLELTSGGIYHDDLGLTAGRERLRWYPSDVWRYVLLCQWARVGQEDHLAARAYDVGDPLGGGVLVARLIRDLMRLGLLLHRRYPPYGKWLGTAFAALPGAFSESDLPTALRTAAAWTNEALGLDLDVTLRPFHDRPFLVLGVDRFVDAIRAQIGDPVLRGLPPYGAVDQFVDSTDVLGDILLLRSFVRAYLT